MRICYLGNFGPSYSTESHVAADLEWLGHEVARLQEGEVRAVDVPDRVAGSDLFLWTQTRDLADAGGMRAEREDMLARIDCPTVGFHLDRWWGLSRERFVLNDPFFRVDALYTADGGHQDEWARAGVNHRWSPPGVFGGEALDVPARPEFESEIVFVGAWRDYGHREWWPTRHALLSSLRHYFGDRVKFWPQGPAVRGLDLNALFASAKIVVGDSCLSGGITHYWSDRVPETLGRGGFLLHPRVEGIEEHFEDGEHLVLYEHGEYEDLAHTIDYFLAHDDEREAIRRAGSARVRAHHTYRNRMETILGDVQAA